MARRKTVENPLEAAVRNMVGRYNSDLREFVDGLKDSIARTLLESALDKLEFSSDKKYFTIKVPLKPKTRRTPKNGTG